MKREPTEPDGITASRSGQAMVELMAGLIVVLVLTAALVQVSSLTRAHTDCMAEARRLAGRKAVQSASDDEGDLPEQPAYILDWNEGPDGKRHTRDDFHSGIQDPMAMNNTIVEKSVGTPAEWTVIDRIEDNRLTELRGQINPPGYYGFVRGYDSRSVDLLPAVRHFLYRKDRIEVESQVWLPTTGGMY